jgi:hypothetical protein
MLVRPAVGLVVAALAVLALGTGHAAAQGQSGTIAGVVRDSSGAILPGVSVEAASPALIEKVRSVVTDGTGAYRIVDLRPGTYSVTFTLSGFSIVKREGVELTAGFTANVNADLRIGALEETITVTGTSPIVDTQNVAKLATASREVMDVLPTDRNFVSFAAMTPAVLVTGVRQNVGGSIPETGMNLVVHGSRASDSLVMVEGMPIINGSGTGGLQYGNYLNNALAQEITFQTGSQNAEFERATVYSNFIPKEGSNTFRGSFSSRYAGEGWQSDNLSQDLIARGLTTGNRINRIWDLNPALGGPLVRDRLWIYGSYRHWGTYNSVAQSFEDADYSAFFYTPSDKQNLFPVWHQSAVTRITTQVNEKNKVNVYTDWQYTYFGNCFVPTYLTAISACPVYKNIPQYILQGTWSSPVTNKFLLEAGGTITPQDFHGYRRPGVSDTQFSVSDPLVPAGMPTTWGSSANYGYNRSDQSNYRASASYVTGTHNIKAGFTMMHSWRYNTQEMNNSVTLQLRNSQPFQVTQFATPIQYHETLNHNLGIYAQDQWTVRRLTMNYGVRFDFLNARVDAQDIAAGPFTPAHHFDEIENVPRWRDVDPRFGIAYDLFGDGKTAVKASIGRYVVGDSYTIARAVNPVQSSVNSTTRSWAAPAGVAYTGTYNPYDDCDLFNPAANTKRPGAVQCGALANPAFGQLTTRTTNYDPDVVEGWHKRPYNWEGQVSIQREILPRISVYGGYARRSYGNLFATRNLAVTNADYTPYCVTLPANDPRLPNTGNQQCGYFDVNRNIAPNNLIFNSSKVGGIEDVYDGFDFDVNARLSGNTIITGGLSWGRERINTCNLKDDLSLTAPASARTTDPRADEFCDTHPNWNPQIKGQFSYLLPWDVNFSATYQSLSGPEIRAQCPVNSTVGGRPLCPATLNRPFTSTAPTVDIVSAGLIYGDRIYQTDIRFSRTIRYGNTRVRPTVSIYNLFNSNAVQTYTNTYGVNWQAPLTIMQSRFIDVGVQVDF